jgi:single-strand DNA-binding protein
MSDSVNKVTLIGNLGADPEIRTLQTGERIARLRVATSETWKDRNTGECTEWHNVLILAEELINAAERYLKEGNKVYIEGKLRNRKWQGQDGQDRYTIEVVLQGTTAVLIALDRAQHEDTHAPGSGPHDGGESPSLPSDHHDLADDLGYDDIPF